MISKEAIYAALVTLARTIVRAGRETLDSISRAESATDRLERFVQLHAASLAMWAEKKSTFIGFLIKLAVAFATDFALLEPLARALVIRIIPGAEIAATVAAIFAPIPVIVAECFIAVKYAKAKEWEGRLGTTAHSGRWLALGLIVAAIPATLVLALGMMSTVTAAALGWAALAGRQALNIVLALVSVTLHVLVVFSGTTPSDFVKAVDAVIGKIRRQKIVDNAWELVRVKYNATLALASRYENARTEHDGVHGVVAVYPFPESVLKLIRRELPNFGRPRKGSDLPFIPIDPDDEPEQPVYH
ncbi:MAG TPA: hypothetical protein VNM92_12120 [Thermoanaerobaculia bacterium]|nr:hypothetical protein [Thermoanaerobaculia bacterium]